MCIRRINVTFLYSTCINNCFAFGDILWFNYGVHGIQLSDKLFLNIYGVIFYVYMNRKRNFIYSQPWINS